VVSQGVDDVEAHGNPCAVVQTAAIRHALIERFTGLGYAAVHLDIKQFEAINNAGGNNPSYPWVEAVIRLMRPSIAIGVIGTWSLCKFVPDLSCGSEVDNFAAAIGFYLFGDRSLFYATKK